MIMKFSLRCRAWHLQTERKGGSYDTEKQLRPSRHPSPSSFARASPISGACFRQHSQQIFNVTTPPLTDIFAFTSAHRQRDGRTTGEIHHALIVIISGVILSAGVFASTSSQTAWKLWAGLRCWGGMGMGFLLHHHCLFAKWFPIKGLSPADCRLGFGGLVFTPVTSCIKEVGPQVEPKTLRC